MIPTQLNQTLSCALPADDDRLQGRAHRPDDSPIVEAGELLQSRQKGVHAIGALWNGAARISLAVQQKENVVGSGPIAGCHDADLLKVGPANRLDLAVRKNAHDLLIVERDAVPGPGRVPKRAHRACASECNPAKAEPPPLACDRLGEDGKGADEAEQQRAR